ncbi:hypothetical protein BOX15_Mlig022203g2 [Macrostomum lignano]|uniref:Protein kinase domain-containing protein n=1 Tax=Macrostomum lignano TaxID=282301 RepID=A0A267H4H6_9PLAT|nr:hypothetical protein BOX15_Mlig022203g2 [Macrostomum lignano]
MDDVVSWVRSNDAIRVRHWLDDPQHDPSWTDDHQFTLLHWAAWEGHIGLADMLATRGGGGGVDAKNAGGDTPLHAAASHGHSQLVRRLLQLRAQVDATNEHGNTPLHYACFNNYPETALELLMAAAAAGRSGSTPATPLGRENRYGQAPIDLARQSLAVELRNAAVSLGLDPDRRQPWFPTSVSSSDSFATLGRSILVSRQQSGVTSSNRSTENLAVDCRSPEPPLSPAANLTGPPTLLNRQISRQLGKQLRLIRPMSIASSGFVGVGGGRSQLWLGVWLGDQAVAEAQVAVRVYRLMHNVAVDMTERVARLRRELTQLAPRLRVLNCPQIQPLLAANVVDGVDGGNHSGGLRLTLVSGYLQLGSLYWLLHGNKQGEKIEIDKLRIAKFALDIATGMDYLSRMDPPLGCYQLNSKSIVIDDNLTAKLSLSNCRFPVGPGGLRGGSLQQRQPAWQSPESLAKPEENVNTAAAHMWSYGVLLWELGTQQVPFSGLLPMEVGLLIASKGLRLPVEALDKTAGAAAAAGQTGDGAARWMARLFAMATNELPGSRPRFQALLPVLAKIAIAAERSAVAS